MKIRPVILCGGSGTRLWPDKKHHQPKQFIDFGNWTLFGKTLERIKNSIFDYPVISTNQKYISEIKKHLRLKGFKKYKIILEPVKRNTAGFFGLSDLPKFSNLFILSSTNLSLIGMRDFSSEILKPLKLSESTLIFFLNCGSEDLKLMVSDLIFKFFDGEIKIIT